MAPNAAGIHLQSPGGFAQDQAPWKRSEEWTEMDQRLQGLRGRLRERHRPHSQWVWV